MQEADRLPKHIKDLTCVKTLKALALLRMSKDEQAHQLFDEIDINSDLDAITLQTMTTFYKESMQVQKIIDIYEAACKRRPTNPELFSQLFMAYVRTGNYKKQKEVAINMNRNIAGNNRVCSFWAIMSLVMQAATEKDQVNNKVCLALAERMCAKLLDEERTQEEIELYLLILRRQNNFEEEYKTLTGPLCNRMPDHLGWFNRRRAYLCLDLKMYSRAFKHYFPSLISEYPDQIEYYEGLFKAALCLDLEPPQPSVLASPSATANKSPIPALVECIDIVDRHCNAALEVPNHDLQNKGGNRRSTNSRTVHSSSNHNLAELKKSLRGPFMARFELLRVILDSEDKLPRNIFEQCKNAFYAKHLSLDALILDYFQSFGRKIVFHYDIDYILSKHQDNIDTERLLATISDWINCLDSNSTNENTRVDKFFIKLNYYILQHMFLKPNLGLSHTEVTKLFVRSYDESLTLARKFNYTEFLPQDHYCLLAINAYMNRSELTAQNVAQQRILSDSQIFSLIIMANDAIINSINNHQIKLILIKLYNFIGSTKTSSNVLDKLDIKHFQIDTLGHLLNPVLYYSGHYLLSTSSLNTCLKFYIVGLRDCLDGLVTSYKDRRFSKIEEVTRVKVRLEYSLNNLQCLLLTSIIENVNVSSPEELQSFCKSFKTNYSNQLREVLMDGNYIDREGNKVEKGDLQQANNISDNRDFRVLKSFSKIVEERIKAAKVESLRDETLWMHVRCNLLECVYLCHSLANYDTINSSSTSSSRQQQVETLLLHEDGDNGISSGGGSHDKNDSYLRELLLHCFDSFCKYRSIAIEQHSSFKQKQSPYSFLEPELSPLKWTTFDLTSHLNLIGISIQYCIEGLFNQELHDSYLYNLGKILAGLEEQVNSIRQEQQQASENADNNQSYLFTKIKYLNCLLVQALETISLAVSCLVSLKAYVGNQVVAAQASASASSSSPPPPPPPSSAVPLADSRQLAQAEVSKLRASKQALISKTEACLTKMSSIARSGVDYKLVVNNCRLETDIASCPSAKAASKLIVCLRKCGSPMTRLLDVEVSIRVV